MAESTKIAEQLPGVADLAAPDRDQQTATRASWLYFVEGKTQEQIAKHLGINRIRVNRILAMARETGMVQVRINSNLSACVELEHRLLGEFGMREAYVVPSPIEADSVRRMVAFEGGRLLSERLAPGMVIAVGWGRTLRMSLQSMERRAIPGLEIVSLTGGLTRGSVMNSYETALRLADMFGAECSYIAGPAFTDSEATRDMLMRQAMLVDAFEHARKADIAYISVGGLDMETSMAKLGLIGPADVATLSKAGAVGDLLGYFIDENGEIVDHPLNRRVLALPPADLANIPSVILVTGGEQRYRAIRAALRKGFVGTLVTDERTAALICGQAQPSGERQPHGG